MKPKKKSLVIPAPVANRMDKVLVLNYRNNKWEPGIITCLEYKNAWGSFSWGYDVVTVRHTKSGYGIKLYVGDEDIEELK